MLRTAPLLVLAALLFASTAVAASDSGPGAATGETCAEKQAANKGANSSASTTRGAVPARETRAKPNAQGDLPGSRMQSPRWHSFLPGMFR